MPRTGLLLALILPFAMFASPGTAQSNFKTLYKFRTLGGGTDPTAGVVFDRAGNIYGTTNSGGGNYDQGILFKLAPTLDGSWTETTIHEFTNGEDGGRPLGALIFDQAGNLYGTTTQGGTYDDGVVFKLTPNSDGTWTETAIHTFSGPDGLDPFGGVTFDQAGNLYGTTIGGGSTACTGGCGVVYKLAPNADGTWTESVLHAFCLQSGCADGAAPYSQSLIFDQSGNLYGTTTFGGNTQCGINDGCGTIFELKPNADGSWSESVLYAFCSLTNCTDGQYPYAGLAIDKSGNLYGTTEFGGSAGGGAVIKLSRTADGGWIEKVIHNFVSEHGGGEPDSSVIFDNQGNLYGSTFAGGIENGGVVYELSPISGGQWQETLLHSFQVHVESEPNAVAFDAAGNLYSTTSGNGGAVFEIIR